MELSAKNRISSVAYGAVDICYYAAFALYVLAIAIDLSMVSTPFGIPRPTFKLNIFYVVGPLLMLKYITQHNSLPQHVAMVAAVTLGFLTWNITQVDWLFWVAMFSFAAKGINEKVIAWIVAVEVSLIAVVFYVLSSNGVIESFTLVRDRADGTQFIRHAFGFLHPNSFGCYMLMVCLALSVIRFNKFPIVEIIFAIVFSYINVMWVDSRAALAVCAVFIVMRLVMYYVKSDKIRRIVNVMALLAVIGTMLVSFWAIFYFDETDSFQVMLDKSLSSRLSLAHAYHEAIGPIKPFGYLLAGMEGTVGNGYLIIAATMDNGFSHYLVRLGWVPTLVFCGSVIALYIQFIKQNRWDATLLGLTLMLIYGISETMGVILACNYFLIALSCLIYPENRLPSDSLRRDTLQ